MSRSPRVCLICSHGGHLYELHKAVDCIAFEKSYWVTFKTVHTKKEFLKCDHFFVIDPVVSKFKYLINVFQSLCHLLKFRPKVVISTGAGIAIPTLLLAKFLLGSKIVFIESAASVNDLSKTGYFMYGRADLFFVQWRGLQEKFPESKYIGVL